MFLAPAFLNEGDSDHDGRLSRDEFQTLAHKWFLTWDTNKSGKLDEVKIRRGLNATLGGDRGFGPPRGPGPGNRGPGLFLHGAEGKRNGVAAAAGVEFTYVHSDLELEGQAFNNVAVRYKGNGTFLESRGSLKRSFKVDLSRFVKGQKVAGVTKLNLHNNVTDASWMNEVLSYRLYRDAGLPAPRSAYARVFVTVPGKFEHKYFGLYSLVEDVDSSFAVLHFNAKHGAIFKRSPRASFQIWEMIGPSTNKPTTQRRRFPTSKNSASLNFAAWLVMLMIKILPLKSLILSTCPNSPALWP
jgi:hypothetical protein